MVKKYSALATLVFTSLVCGITAKFELIKDVGYYYYGTDKDWAAAEKDCTSLGAKLVVINSEAEKKAMVDFIALQTPAVTSVYAGFTNKNEADYVTVDGLSLDDAGYSTWAGGKPSDNKNPCGVFTTDGELRDEVCTTKMAYVCEHQLWYDYEFHEGFGHYTMHTDGQSWLEASKICRREGAHLLVLDSQAEADVVMEIFQRHSSLPNTTNPNVAYLGFRAVNEDLTTDPWNGTYLTIFGTSVSDLGYVKWYSTEPQPGDAFFCGVLYRQSASYMMYSCNGRIAFFCEKEQQGFIRV